MKKLIPALALLLIASGAYGFECKVCHSKNPAMVRMHKALQGRNCFDCHKMGEKLMGKGIPKDKAAQIKRRESEQICFECHRPSPKGFECHRPSPKASAGTPAQ